MIGGPNSLVFVTALLAALATPVLGWAKGKHVNHSAASRKTAPPVVMSPLPIPIPRPNRAPLESAGEDASTAQGRPNDRQATRAGKNRSVIVRPSNDEDQRVPPRAVLREVARRVSVAGGVIVLPVVAFSGRRSSLMCPGSATSTSPRTSMPGFTTNYRRQTSTKSKPLWRPCGR